MSEIAVIHDSDVSLVPATGPGRRLGQRRKPQLRLAMGYRDENRSGAPVKTEYFLPRGDDRAVAKFHGVYGDKPRAVRVRLPGTMDGFLDIQHLAFAKSKSGQAYLRAAGHRNFATDGRLGGADWLTVYEYGDGDLRVIENVPITGVDDPVARELGLALQMTVSFGVPDVLGLGGLCQVTSKGKESMDTLFLGAADIYGMLGSFASIAVQPMLVLKPSTMLTPKGTKSPLWVLDLWLPESMDEIYARLERHHALVPQRAQEAMSLLYGSPVDASSHAIAAAPGMEAAGEPEAAPAAAGGGASEVSEEGEPSAGADASSDGSGGGGAGTPSEVEAIVPPPSSSVAGDSAEGAGASAADQGQPDDPADGRAGPPLFNDDLDPGAFVVPAPSPYRGQTLAKVGSSDRGRDWMRTYMTDADPGDELGRMISAWFARSHRDV